MNRHFIQVLASVVVLLPATVQAKDAAFAKLDLRDYGYELKLGNVSKLHFLSDEILLVTIYHRGGRPYEVKPESTFVVFDISRGKVNASKRLPVGAWSDTVQPISKERFALLNSAGLYFCDQTLHCERIKSAKGPIIASPQGKRVAVGGYEQPPTEVIDTETLEQVAVSGFTGLGPSAIPGDEAVLVNSGYRITIPTPVAEIIVGPVDMGPSSEFRFLSERMFGYLDSRTSEAVVANLEGKQLWHYKVPDVWRTGFLSSASGKRFAIYEHRYTTWNQIWNFLDIDGTRPWNYESVRVMDLSSGRELLRLKWDPRPTDVIPALSPSGEYLARVKAGILEVFYVN